MKGSKRYKQVITRLLQQPRLLSKLPDTKLRDILSLHYLCGLSWQEVADTTYYSIENIYKLRREALDKLEVIINGENKRH